MITFHTVGTSAVAPTARRNLSANLINFRGERILFDCGEGAQRTIMQKNLGLMKINKIFITHWHADHFSGLLGLIQTLSMEDRKKPLEIYGPPRTEEFMDMLLNLGYFDRSYNIEIREIEEGDVIKDKIHAHITVADDSFHAKAGHCSSAKVSGTFEILITLSKEFKLEHKFEEETGLDVFDI